MCMCVCVCVCIGLHLCLDVGPGDSCALNGCLLCDVHMCNSQARAGINSLRPLLPWVGLRHLVRTHWSSSWLGLGLL